MVPRKRTCESGSGTRFDHSKFVSTKVAERHMHLLVHNVPIPERVIDLHLKLYSWFIRSLLSGNGSKFLNNLILRCYPWFENSTSTLLNKFMVKTLCASVRVLGVLCDEGVEWKMTKGILVSFKASTMKIVHKLWYHFLAAQLLPVKHISDVTRDRAILLYAIIYGMLVNVGQVIFTSIA
ncbi:Uncharacterized protein TCM_009655 [Theobroma cacao]|uniref:Putative plant transposon protein domain-containing protein n=1 Tax=Theobroma cacao TaxID=3641 RepID=A0A061ECX4_THECC|nr:Uncharacterized protein TCM_009655 [Theobroma cacao]